MALIKCPDCQTAVSGAALSCPKCGCVREPSALGQFAKGLLLVFNVVMAVWFIVEVTSVLPQTSRVMVPWAAGSVILGMLALVYQRPQRQRGTKPPMKESEDPVMSRAIARRYARGEGLIGKPRPKRGGQGGRGTEPPTDEAGRGCQNPDDQPGNDRPRHEKDGASF